MNTRDNVELELRDLGDATDETRQGFYYPELPDSTYRWGWLPG